MANPQRGTYSQPVSLITPPPRGTAANPVSLITPPPRGTAGRPVVLSGSPPHDTAPPVAPPGRPVGRPRYVSEEPLHGTAADPVSLITTPPGTAGRPVVLSESPPHDTVPHVAPPGRPVGRRPTGRPVVPPVAPPGRPVGRRPTGRPVGRPRYVSDDSEPYLGPPLFKDMKPPVSWLSTNLGFDDKDSMWRGVRVLGEGGQGKAGLWVRVDKSNKITDRVVCKESSGYTYPLLGGDPFYTYDQEVNWLNGQVGTQPLEKVYNDIATVEGQASNSSKNHSYNITVRGSKAFDEKKALRLYLEYCPYGNLTDLFSSLRDLTPFIHRDAHGKQFTDQKKLSETDPLPEPLIWCLFYSLATAAIHMSQLPKAKKYYPPAVFSRDGLNVVHLDIKPQNVFLAAPWPDFFPQYPSIRLGDWGSAMLTWKGDPENRNTAAGRPTTYEYEVPEMLAQEYEARQDVGPSTNVYQIALTILDMIYLGCDNRTADDVTANQRVKQLSESKAWSEELVQILTACLLDDPVKRTSPEDLRDTLRRGIDGDHGKGMNGPKALDPSSMKHWVSFGPKDRYKTGMSYVGQPGAKIESWAREDFDDPPPPDEGTAPVVGTVPDEGQASSTRAAPRGGQADDDTAAPRGPKRRRTTGPVPDEGQASSTQAAPRGGQADDDTAAPRGPKRRRTTGSVLDEGQASSTRAVPRGGQADDDTTAHRGPKRQRTT